MTPETFTLQHSDIPQTKLHDGECATRDWPMPDAKPWTPVKSDRLEVAQRIALIWDRMFG